MTHGTEPRHDTKANYGTVLKRLRNARKVCSEPHAGVTRLAAPPRLFMTAEHDEQRQGYGKYRQRIDRSRTLPG